MALRLSSPAVATLESRQGTKVFLDPVTLPGAPCEAACVMQGVRCASIRASEDEGTFCAAAHLRFDEWLPLAAGVSFDDACFAIGAFLGRVQNIPQFYAPENDAAERAAAHAVLEAFFPSALPTEGRLAA